jgi:hypothetical protein
MSEGLFDTTALKVRKVERLEDVKRPILVAYGDGVDSTAMIFGLHDFGIRPDAILFADTGGEKGSTYKYLPVMQKWLKSKGWPQVTVVRYKPKKFLRYPPYHDLESNCLSNGTLPSITFGFGSCSLKWKAAPQERWCDGWRAAAETWARGDRIIKLIGFDASPGDLRRRNNAGSDEDKKYEYRYPLQSWGWNRDRCITRIVDERLPGWHPGYLKYAPKVTLAWEAFVTKKTKEAWTDFKDAVRDIRKALYWVERGGIPMKSSCFFCAAMKMWEVILLPVDKLERIVIMEARAKPRHHTIQGLWRKATKIKPGSMTEFIVKADLLPAERVEKLQGTVPKELMNGVTKWLGTGEEIDWEQFFKSNGVKPQGFCGDSTEDS